MDPLLQQKIAAILAFILKLIGHSERLVREGRFREYLRVTFLGKDTKTQKLLEELNQLFGSEQRFVLGITYRSVQKSEEATAEIRSSLTRTSEHVERVLDTVTDGQKKRSQTEDDELLSQMLCNTTAHEDVEEIFARNAGSLLKGTGDWLTDEPFFRAWLEEQASVLWIFGGPGAGKSYLSTWIVKHLGAHASSGTSTPTAYFFVKENSAVLRDPNNILKTLA